MSTPDRGPARISRRTFLHGATAAAATLAATSLPVPALALAERPGNVRVSNDDYQLHVEPNVASNPRDPRNLLGASQVGPVADSIVIATYASFAGGSTWRSNGALPLPPATASANDVTVGFDGQGAGFVCAMAASGLSRNDRGVYVWRTDDGGRSFAAPVAAMKGQFADHPWLAVDHSRRDAPGNLYAVWVAADHGALGFGRSTDGGRTFEPPRMIQGPADRWVYDPMVAGGAGGTVCAVYEVPPPARIGPDAYMTIEALCSTDYGATFGEPVALGLEAAVMSLPGGLGIPSGPTVAVAPHRAAIYSAFVTHQPEAPHSDIVLSASFDHGRTWSVATPVTPQDQAIYFHPQLAVDGAGRIAVSAFALRQGRVDVVLFVSEPDTLRFGSPLVVTSQSFDPTQGGLGSKYGGWWIGDYQGLASTPDAFHPFWNDTRTGQLELFTATVRGR